MAGLGNRVELSKDKVMNNTTQRAPLEIVLVDKTPELCDAWTNMFSETPLVEVLHADITSVECDAIVSPANSFGFMDGGLDLALSNHFGWDLQSRLQTSIANLPEKELLVGQALIIPTNYPKCPWLISAPTMRVPMSFNIATSVNAYLAMKAILIVAHQYKEIKRVAVPGLCTGVGKMPPEIASKQMFMAYQESLDIEARPFSDFGEAQLHQTHLNPDGLIWDF